MSPGMAVRVEPGTAMGPVFDRLMTGAEIPLFVAAVGAVSVIVQAHPDNNADDIVWVGPAGIGPGLGGVALAPSASIVINIENAALIFAFGATVTDRVVGFIVR